MIVRIACVALALGLVCASAHAAPLTAPFLFEGASIHGDKVAFACGGKLWLVGVDGGTAQPLTAGGYDSLPVFSPDGSHLAFVRRSERLTNRLPVSPDDPPPTLATYDVYVRDGASGEEHRLTVHPARDFPVGWTVDSKQVLINSSRDGLDRLFTMKAGDQLPTALPLPGGYFGCFSPDGKRMAYLPRSFDYHFSEFRHYRGGKCAPLWLVDLASGDVERVTDGTFNVRDPMWVGDRVYFLSDAGGRFDLYVHDVSKKSTGKVTDLGSFAARSAATDGKSIVLAGHGSLQVFDLKSKVAKPLAVELPDDTTALRPRIVNAVRQAQSYGVSGDGKQAVVCARGDVFLVDTATGKTANITKSSGVAEREAQLSFDGRRLAYFSDASGEYALHVRGVQDGKETVLPIEPRPSYYRELTWSPDGKLIAFADKHLAVWLADVGGGVVKKIDTAHSSSQDSFFLSWSPDGRYLAYAKHGDDRLSRIYAHEVQSGDTREITPDDCHATWPVFDKSGRYLYFLSSPNGPATDFGWSVMAGVLARPLVIRQLNVVVLAKDGAAPILGSLPNLSVRWEDTGTTTIDFEGIDSRIVPVDLGTHLPAQLAAAEAGVLHIVVEVWPPTPGLGAAPTQTLYRLDLRSPAEAKKTVPMVSDLAVSHDGKTILCGGGGAWRVATFQGARVTLRPLTLAALPVPVDPAREWQQMTHETWRLMRDFFYDPNTHGLDWAAVERQYAEFLPGVRSREQLNVLLRRLIGHMSVSHSGAGGGDLESNLNEPDPIGLLGADFEIADGLYRVKRVLRADPLDGGAATRAPLAQRWAEVEDGEYLLAIDDEPLDATQNIYEALRGKATRPVRLLVGRTTDPAKARSVRVVPLENEVGLRMADWARRNRETVEKLSDGKLGYFYMPTWGAGDISRFFRGFFANRGKPGFIIDQRHNGGGITPDYFIEMLARRPLYYYLFRDGDELAVPVNGRPNGTTVLLIDDDNASAAETFAFMFRLGKIGPLVGRRTFGAGIGPYGYASRLPQLVDGGRVRIPSRGAYDPSGSWVIENEGVPPHVSVDILPADWRAGRDSQLEAAVQAGLDDLKNQHPAAPRRPKFPVHP